MVSGVKYRAPELIKFFTGFIWVLLLTVPTISSAAGCCGYSLNKSVAPDWLTDLQDANILFNKTKSACPSASDIPALSSAKIYSFYQNEPFVFANNCAEETNAEVKTFVAATKKYSCCVLYNKESKPIYCQFKTPGSIDSCVQVLSKELAKEPQGSSSIKSFEGMCANVVPCKELAAAKSTSAPATGGAAATAAVSDIVGAPKPWEKTECASVKTAEGDPRYVWLPPSDQPNLATGNYCFVRPLKAQLEISIGSIGTIKSIGEYINVVYKYIIGFGVLAVVLTIIVSGFQWMVSGIADQIGAAKKRIGNALLGLLLLVGANIVIYTVNPQILQLRAPLMKAVRPQTFGAEKFVNCDPDVQPDSCVTQYGDNFYCKQSFKYIDDVCAKKARNYQMLFTGTVAAMVALPAVVGAVSGGGGAGATAQGAWQWIKGQLTLKGAAGNVVREEVAEVFSKKIVKAVAPLMFGVGIAAIASNSKDAGQIKGYCTEMKHDQEDYKVCRFDKECVSGACLLTADIACGALQLGVCVSGQLREPCAKGITKALATIYDKNSAVKKSAAEVKKIYGCKDADAHCVGKIGKDEMLGFCSNGLEVGMGCDGSLKCGNNLVCVKKMCRDVGYFYDNGRLKKWGAACLTAFDCGIDEVKSVSPTYCLKVNKERGAWLSGTGTLTEPPIYNVELIEAVKTPGMCVFDSPQQGIKYSSTNKTKYAADSNQPCFVNLSACADSECKKVADSIQASYTSYYATLDSSVQNVLSQKWAERFQNGVKFEIVGCGWASQQWTGSVAGEKPDTGYCQIKIASFFGNEISKDNISAVNGSCVFKGQETINLALPGFKSTTTVVEDVATIITTVPSSQPIVTIKKQGTKWLERVPSYYYIDKAFQLY